MSTTVAIRNIVIYSTVGNRDKTISSDVTTYGELLRVLDRNEIQYKNMTAVEGDSQHTYDSPDAVLPTGEFTLFLLPKEVKSGDWDDDDDEDDDDFEEDDDNDDESVIPETVSAKIELIEQILKELKAQIKSTPSSTQVAVSPLATKAQELLAKLKNRGTFE